MKPLSQIHHKTTMKLFILNNTFISNLKKQICPYLRLVVCTGPCLSLSDSSIAEDSRVGVFLFKECSDCSLSTFCMAS